MIFSGGQNLISLAKAVFEFSNSEILIFIHPQPGFAFKLLLKGALHKLSFEFRISKGHESFKSNDKNLVYMKLILK